jgi:hypothetical protein
MAGRLNVPVDGAPGRAIEPEASTGGSREPVTGRTEPAVGGRGLDPEASTAGSSEPLNAFIVPVAVAGRGKVPVVGGDVEAAAPPTRGGSGGLVTPGDDISAVAAEIVRKPVRVDSDSGGAGGGAGGSRGSDITSKG